MLSIQVRRRCCMSRAEDSIRRFARAVSDAVLGTASDIVTTPEDLNTFRISQIKAFSTVRPTLVASNLLGTFVAWSSLGNLSGSAVLTVWYAAMLVLVVIDVTTGPRFF